MLIEKKKKSHTVSLQYYPHDYLLPTSTGRVVYTFKHFFLLLLRCTCVMCICPFVFTDHNTNTHPEEGREARWKGRGARGHLPLTDSHAGASPDYHTALTHDTTTTTLLQHPLQGPKATSTTVRPTKHPPPQPQQSLEKQLYTTQL